MPAPAMVTTSAVGAVSSYVNGVLVAYDNGVSGRYNDVSTNSSVAVFAPASAQVCSYSSRSAYTMGSGFLMVATYLM